MSFDLFVECYGETKQIGIPKNAISSLFPVSREEGEFDCWVVEYDSLNRSDIYYSLIEEDKGRLTGLMVARPCGDLRLWDAIYSVAQMGSVVVLWPGSRAVFAEGANIAALPEGMLEDFGGPVFVHSGAEILKLVQET